MKNFIILFLSFISFVLFSCSKEEFSKTSTENLVMNSAPRIMKSTGASYDSSSDSMNLFSNDSENLENTTEKKLIKNGNISIEVKSLYDAEISIKKWCKNLGGYVSDSSSSNETSNFCVKIPTTKFDEAMESIGNLGIVKEYGTSTQDVTEQFFDLKTRLENKKVMKENLKKYLSQAKDIKDMLQIEKELNTVISDIEAMEGRLKRLNNQIDYSTINVEFSLPYGKVEHGIKNQNISNIVREFVSNVLAFFSSCSVIFLYIIICGIPILAIISFLFWILWGRVGLLRKLYFWLKK